MRVLIVAKTRMGGDHCCIGGLDLKEDRNLRLLTKTGDNQPISTGFAVGDIWEINYTESPHHEAPHIEDVLGHHAYQVGRQEGMGEFLLQHVMVWRGTPQCLFDGKLRYTSSGSGYICRDNGIPNNSTGYWVADVGLIRDDFGTKVRYFYPSFQGIRHITYVGMGDPVDEIPEGALIRVSLARWWQGAGADEKRCYLQISGWYLN